MADIVGARGMRLSAMGAPEETNRQATQSSGCAEQDGRSTSVTEAQAKRS
jgi:hypothetical protein